MVANILFVLVAKSHRKRPERLILLAFSTFFILLNYILLVLPPLVATTSEGLAMTS